MRAPSLTSTVTRIISVFLLFRYYTPVTGAHNHRSWLLPSNVPPGVWSCIIRKVDQGVEISVNNRCGGCATPPTLPHYAAVHRKIRAKSFVAPGLLVPSWSRFAPRRGGAALTPRLQAGR